MLTRNARIYPEEKARPNLPAKGEPQEPKSKPHMLLYLHASAGPMRTHKIKPSQIGKTHGSFPSIPPKQLCLCALRSRTQSRIGCRESYIGSCVCCSARISKRAFRACMHVIARRYSKPHDQCLHQLPPPHATRFRFHLHIITQTFLCFFVFCWGRGLSTALSRH